jgi:hypothetical protein
MVMESILPIIIAIVVMFVVFKVAKGIIKTIGLLIVLALAVGYVYYTGAFG